MLKLICQLGRRYGRHLAAASLVALVVCLLYKTGFLAWFIVPWPVPLVLGLAVCLYLSTRTSQQHAQLRQVWQLGADIVTASRIWTMRVLTHVPADEAGYRRQLLRRHVGWVHATSLQLRGDLHNWDAEVGPYLDPVESAWVQRQPNPALQLLHRQAALLRIIHHGSGQLQAPEYSIVLDALLRIYELQGHSEQLVIEPEPAEWPGFSPRLQVGIIVVTPLSLVGGCAQNDPYGVWLTVPLSVFICVSFAMLGMRGGVQLRPVTRQAFRKYFSTLTQTVVAEAQDLRMAAAQQEFGKGQ